MSLVEKIKEIEDEMAKTQRNKATNSHLGLLKAKLAKLKSQLLTETGGGKKGGGEGFDVSKSGDCRVGLVGFPSVGKSTLLNVLTNTFSEVASYEFTTLTCIPGVIQYKGARIQLLDLPGIIEGAKDGKGRGRQVISTAHTCNLILIVLDCLKPLDHKRILERELEGFGIRLNKKPPNITFKKRDKGGLSMMSTVPLTKITEDDVRDVLREMKCPSADVIFRHDATIDELIDVIEDNRVYIPCIYVMNKIDQITIEELDLLDQIKHVVPVCAQHKWNLDGLLEKMWEYLDLIRIYTKPKGQLTDFSEPVILKREKNTVTHFCNRIHKGILKKFRYAWVWGESVKHNPQKVGQNHELKDEDIVQIVKSV